MKFKYFAFFLMLGFLSAGIYSLSAKELEKEARVIFTKGDAKVEKAGKPGWVNAKEGMLLADGDTAKTGKSSVIELSFDKENKNLVRLEENSTMILHGKMLNQIELPQGRIRSLVKSLKKETSFEIKTPTIIAGARGSGWDVDTTGKRDNVKAFEDEIFVQSYDQQGKLIKEIYVREGWEVTIDRFQAPGELIELTDRDKNDWSSWRDDLNDRLQTGGAKEENRTGNFDNVQSIEQTTDKQDEFKQDILENEDTRKIDERIHEENVRDEPVSHGGGGGSIYFPPVP